MTGVGEGETREQRVDQCSGVLFAHSCTPMEKSASFMS